MVLLQLLIVVEHVLVSVMLATIAAILVQVTALAERLVPRLSRRSHPSILAIAPTATTEIPISPLP